MACHLIQGQGPLHVSINLSSGGHRGLWGQPSDDPSGPAVCLCVLVDSFLHAYTSWWLITGMDHVSKLIFFVCLCQWGCLLEASQMVILLAPYHLANSQTISANASCPGSGITKHDTHQERNICYQPSLHSSTGHAKINSLSSCSVCFQTSAV